jgi:uncharacterized protein YecE (DUF72 family)
MQFPWSFRYVPSAAEWLQRLAEAFADFGRFVEVRHVSWSTDEALDTLRRVGGYCNIDQPVLRDCLGPTTHVFGRSAYVRLHGRNAQNWFAQGQPGYERYNYTYTEAELREWVARIVQLGADADDVYVFANNHYRGQGPLNALELKGLLTGSPVEVPAELLAAYPRLSAVARAQPPTSLFDDLPAG